MLCFSCLVFHQKQYHIPGEKVTGDSPVGHLAVNTDARWIPPSGVPPPTPGNHGEPWQSPPERTPSWSVDIKAGMLGAILVKLQIRDSWGTVIESHENKTHATSAVMWFNPPIAHRLRYLVNRYFMLTHLLTNLVNPYFMLIHLFTKVHICWRSWDSLWVKCWTCDWKVASSSPAAAAEAFSSPGLTLCAVHNSASFPSCIITVAHKRPQSFCQKCKRQVTPKYAYTLDLTKLEWADYAVQA